MRFRNVDVSPEAPVKSWPLEALRTALERGDLRTYQLLVHEIRQEPWGPVARRIEQVLGWTQPYGVSNIMSRAIERARSMSKSRERDWVVEQLADAVRRSGLSQANFARTIGTSPSRFSTYVTGDVVPAATLLVRAQSLAQRLEKPSTG